MDLFMNLGLEGQPEAGDKLYTRPQPCPEGMSPHQYLIMLGHEIEELRAEILATLDSGEKLSLDLCTSWIAYQVRYNELYYQLFPTELELENEQDDASWVESIASASSPFQLPVAPATADDASEPTAQSLFG